MRRYLAKKVQVDWYTKNKYRNHTESLKNAKIFVIANSVDTNKLFIDELNNKSKLIQKKIALNLTSKFTPKLKFFIDTSFEYSDKINNILETINR